MSIVRERLARLRLSSESEDLLHLDVLRFVAAAAIVWHHSHEFLHPESARAEVLQRSLGLGMMVDLFFLISGFVIAFVYVERVSGFHGLGRFLQRRVARLLPLHLATVVAAMVVTAAILAAGIAYEGAPSFDARCVASTALLVQEVVACGGETFNGVNWSVSVEMALYLTFPLIVVTGRRRSWLPFAIAAGAMLAGLVLAQDWLSPAAWANVYGPLRGLSAFAFGIGLFFVRDRLTAVRHADVLLLVSLLATVVAMMTAAPTPVVLALVYMTGTLAVAADLSVRARPIVRRMSPLGQLTYSVYLIHALVLLVVVNAVADKFLHLPSVAMGGVLVLSYAVIAITALLSFHWFETPARRSIGRMTLSRRARVAVPEDAIAATAPVAVVVDPAAAQPVA